MNNSKNCEGFLDFENCAWDFYTSSEIKEEDAANVKALGEHKLQLASGEFVGGIACEFVGGKIDFHKVMGKTMPLKSKGIFAAEIFSPVEQTVFFGVGADWWWSCYVNGEKVFDRGESNPDGNKFGSLSMNDWIFPVKFKKGKNTVVFYLVSGMFWSLSAAIFNLPKGSAVVDSAPASDEQKAGFSLIGETDKDMVSYKVGEKIRFKFWIKDDCALDRGGLYLFWNSVSDDGRSFCGCEPISCRKAAEIELSLARAGFLRVIAVVMSFNSGGAEVLARFDGGAGAEIEKLQPAATEPADFVEYWRRQRALLSAVPAEAEVDDYLGEVFPDGVKIPAGLKISLVKVACLGPNPVTGFLARPRKEGKYPIRVVFDGYSKEPKLSHRQMTPGVITFHVNAHGYKLFRGDRYYKDFIEPFERKHPAYGLSAEENSNPDTAYFHGMALRVMRALDFVKQDAMWNGKDLFVQGGSQGGLQAIWAAHLDADVTRCECSINWCSNIAGAALDARTPGWHPEYVRGLDYYDTVFHAKYINEKCFVDVLRIGMGDSTCPPSGIVAMYNMIKCAKRVAFYQNSTHIEVPPEPIISRRERHAP